MFCCNLKQFKYVELPHVLQKGGGVAFPGQLQGIFVTFLSTGSHAKLPRISEILKEFFT